MRTVVGEEARRAQGLALEELSLRNGFLECGLNRGKLGADEGYSKIWVVVISSVYHTVQHGYRLWIG